MRNINAKSSQRTSTSSPLGVKVPWKMTFHSQRDREHPTPSHQEISYHVYKLNSLSVTKSPLKIESRRKTKVWEAVIPKVPYGHIYFWPFPALPPNITRCVWLATTTCPRLWKVLKADPNGMETWQNLQDLSSVVVFRLDVLVGMKLLLLVSNPNN